MKRSESCPKVSVVIPVKNGASHIRELLDSLIQVEYERDKLEIIVVDGNSVDKTREIASQYPVKLLTEERPGLNAARNTGIKNSDGEIVAFTDFDCVIPKNWIREIVENFKDSQIGCVGGNILGYYEDFLSRYSDESVMPVMRIFKKREILDSVKPPTHYPAGCNMAFKREVIKKTGLFDENIKHGFDEDELVERVCRAGYKMALDPNVLVKHKHRSTLRNLLKQNFAYGRGLGNVLKIKRLESAFSKWALLCVGGGVLWGLINLSLIVYALLSPSLVSLAALLTVLFLPLLGLVVFYAYQTTKKQHNRYENIIIYPLIDIGRSLAFVSGIIYQVLKF